MKILCLGDSITGKSDLEKYLKWSAILECMLNAHHTADSIQVVNRGVAGDTTSGVLKRLLEDVLQESPDIVVMLLSGNDAGKKVDRAETKANLNDIVTQIKAKGAKMLLLQYHMLPNPNCPEKAWVHLNSNNDLIKQVAANHDCPILPMRQPMQDALDKYPLVELVHHEDGVHLNPAGELVFASAVFKKLHALSWIH